MLRARARNIVAIVILTVSIAVGGILGWRYASANVVDATVARTPVPSRTSPDPELSHSSVVIAGRSINTEWSVNALEHIGISIATAEKATVALYGAIAGGAIGLLTAGLLAEPIAGVITAWPRRTARIRKEEAGRRTGADGIRRRR
jgi:hypothetical protein